MNATNKRRIGWAAIAALLWIAPWASAANYSAKGQPEWKVDAREPAGIGFAVERAGAIRVDVRVEQGSPVAVELLRGDGRAVANASGAGKLVLKYAATTADVNTGAFWQVRLQLAPGAAGDGQANGTVAITGGVTDEAKLAGKLRAAPAAPAPSAESIAQLQAEVAAATPATQAVASRALPPPDSGTSMLRQRLPADARRATITFPTISALSAPQAIAGQAVTLSGSAFGTQPGQVRFSFGGAAPDADASIGSWGDTQIQATVPAVPGFAPLAATITVTRPDGVQSAAAQFTALPAEEIREIVTNPTYMSANISHPGPVSVTTTSGSTTANTFCVNPNTAQGWTYFPGNPAGAWWVCSGTAGLFGHKGEDEFYMLQRLKNAWVVHDVRVFTDPASAGKTGAYLIDSRIGTDWPYLKVRVWQQPLTINLYTFKVWIRGPRGVPDGLTR